MRHLCAVVLSGAVALAASACSDSPASPSSTSTSTGTSTSSPNPANNGRLLVRLMAAPLPQGKAVLVWPPDSATSVKSVGDPRRDNHAIELQRGAVDPPGWHQHLHLYASVLRAQRFVRRGLPTNARRARPLQSGLDVLPSG